MTTNPELCLQQFVQGTLTVDALEECLQGLVRLKFWDTNQRAVEFLGVLPTVHFTREQIDAQLQRFLAGQLSARELSDWAAVLRLFDCFEIEEPALNGSAAWDLLDELVSPDAWGPLTVETVLDLRRRFAEL